MAMEDKSHSSPDLTMIGSITLRCHEYTFLSFYVCHVVYWHTEDQDYDIISIRSQFSALSLTLEALVSYIPRFVRANVVNI